MLSERVTYDVRDLGWVTDAEGKRFGQVVAVEGSLITWRPLLAGWDVAAE